MKKTLKSISMLMLAASFVLSVTSCKKDEEKVAPALGTATISGKVTYEKDQNNTTGIVPPIAGVTVFVTVNAYDQVVNPNDDINYPTKVYSAVTDASGMYTITLEVGENEVDFDLQTNQFTYDQIKTIVAPATAGVATRTIVDSYSNDYSILKGGALIQDFQLYNY